MVNTRPSPATGTRFEAVRKFLDENRLEEWTQERRMAQACADRALDRPHHEKVRRLQHTIISIAGRPRPRPVNTHALARACYPHFDLPEDTDPDDFYDGITAGETANHAVLMRGRAPTRGVHHSSSLATPAKKIEPKAKTTN